MAKLTFRIWILIIVLILSLISIFGLPPSFLEKGILITGVEKNSEIIYFSKNVPEITFSNIPKTNLKAGLDISGGARALIQAQDKKLSTEEINDLVAITNNRFNVYGISD